MGVNKFFENNEVKQSLWTNPPSKWLSLTEILTKKIKFTIDNGFCRLIDCVDYEYEEFIRDDNKKDFFIKIPPTSEYQDIFLLNGKLETQKFLVYLLNKNIIANLSLPSSIRFEKTKGTVIVQLKLSSYTDYKFALSDALLKPKEFNEKIISFKIINWKSFSKIKEKIKNSKKYKKYIEKKKLEERNKKNREFQIFNLDNNFEQSDDKVFKIIFKDRQIMINDYIIAKPYATGCSRQLLDYIRSQPKNKEIKKEDFPEWLKQDMGKKRIITILGGAGFTGVIKKAFFPIVSKTTIKYRGDEITIKDLKNAGIKIELFKKQLEFLNLKNKE